MWAACPDATVPVLCLTADGTWRDAPECTDIIYNILKNNANVKKSLSKSSQTRLFAGFDQYIEVFNTPFLGLFVRIEINIQFVTLNQPAPVPNLYRL